VKAAAACCCLLGSLSLLPAADFSVYRGFHLGGTIASVVSRAGVEEPIRLIHTRPALIQELAWHPPAAFISHGNQEDPVRAGLLRFYNGHLFQIVATYERESLEGMNDADMVEAISATYGPSTNPAVDIPYQSNYGRTARVLARWENPDCEYSLVRTGDRSSYSLILTSKLLGAEAQTAVEEAVRLDAIEAPQREVASQAKRDAESRLTLDKARTANRLKFRP
jgi:hypothetical protein